MTIPDTGFEILGGLAALGSAASWALTSIMFGNLGEEVPPEGMNLAKCLMGSAMLAAAVPLAGFEPVGIKAALYLGLSGLLGIAAGDTFYFRALVHLGPRLTVLFGALGPALTVLLAVLLLRERPGPAVWAGIALVTAGVAWVMWEQAPEGRTRNRRKGVKYALLSVVCMSAAIILAKLGVASCPPLESTLVRMAWAGAGLLVWGAAGGSVRGWLVPLKNARLLRSLSAAVFLTMFGGFYLALFSLKHAPAAVASTLNSTTPLFIVPLSALMLKERITARAAAAAVMAAAGVVLIFL